MLKLILHLKTPDTALLAARAGKYLVEHPQKEDALLEYEYPSFTKGFYVKRNKASISVWEQP